MLQHSSHFFKYLINDFYLSISEEPIAQNQISTNTNFPSSVTFRKQIYLKISENEKLSIANCIKTSNTLFVTDYNQDRLIICNADGTDIQHMPLPSTPGVVTQVDSNTIAVSCGIAKTILIINISTRSITSTIIVSDICNGISYNDNNLYVVIIGSIIQVMDLTGQVKRSISLPSDRIILDMIVDRDRLVGRDEKSIYCFSLDGTPTWNFRNAEYQALRCLTTDDRGNIYVSNYHPNTVVVVSGDGIQHRVILTESDGLDGPSGIYFDKQANILLVCNRDNGKVFLFDVKWNTT